MPTEHEISSRICIGRTDSARSRKEALLDVKVNFSCSWRKEMAQALDDADQGESLFSDMGLPGRCGAAELEEALSLTGDIYDAALDPALWPEALRRICAYVGGVATALMSQDAAAGRGRFHYSWGD